LSCEGVSSKLTNNMNYINNFNEGLEMKHERCDVKKSGGN